MEIAICAVLLFVAAVWMYFDKTCADIKWVAVLGMVYALFTFWVGGWG